MTKKKWTRLIKLTLSLGFTLFCFVEGYTQVDTTLSVGLVSYTTSTNVYVRLGREDSVEVGDTLFLKQGNQYVPAIRIEKTSSISSVGVKLLDQDFSKNDQLFLLSIVRKETDISDQSNEEQEQETLVEPSVPETFDSLEVTPLYEAKQRGRIAVSSHATQRQGDDVNMRMRYTFSYRNEHIRNSPFSFETYTSYRHNMGPSTENNTTRTEAFRVYSLAMRYNVNPEVEISAGRRINRRLANVGAIDGVQYEHQAGDFIFGAAGGFRPDIQDFGLNTDLLEYGGFVAHEKQLKEGYTQTSLAFFEQRNAGNIDRRFSYFQHNSMPIKRLSIFSSFEVDWYRFQNGKASAEPRLSSLYLSARYRFSRKVSVFCSYDNRNNIIYYETYRTRVEQLLDQATRQGFRMRVNLRPLKYLAVGLTGGYRFQNNNDNDSKNAYAYATYSRVPLINSTLTISTNWFQTAYVDGRIYSARLNRDIIKGKLSGTLQYRLVDYRYTSYDLTQDVVTASLVWRVLKRLSFSLTYEGTFDERNHYNRVHVNLIQRF